MMKVLFCTVLVCVFVGGCVGSVGVEEEISDITSQLGESNDETLPKKSSCTGDCDLDGEIGVHELVLVSNIFKGEQPLERCVNADGNDDGKVSVGDLVRIRNLYTNGCPVPQCVGDCDGDGQVTIAELMLVTQIALEKMPLDACKAADFNLDGHVAVSEAQTAGHNALYACVE